MRLALFGIIAIVLVGGLATTAAAQGAANERDLTRRMQDMRGLEPYSKMRSQKDRRERARELETLLPPALDQAAKERQHRMRMPLTRDVERYKDFFADGKKTGIFRIVPDFDCVSKNVVKVGSECKGFVPETSDFSFRLVAYTNRIYHDIAFDHDALISDSFFSQGILTSLGDVPIEKVDLESEGLTYLREFKPDDSIESAKKTARKIELGMDTDGFHYASSVSPSENTTYALRSIAYGYGGSPLVLTSDSTMTEIKFKSFEMDSRDDVIVVFRIVRKEVDGGLTVVWKELSRKVAPKLKFAKGQPLKDFK
jgi:hypothetical protein